MQCSGRHNTSNKHCSDWGHTYPYLTQGFPPLQQRESIFLCQIHLDKLFSRFPESEKPSSLFPSNTSVGTEEIYLIQTDADAEYQTATELNGDSISENFHEFENQEREKGVDELNFMNNVCSLNEITNFDKSNFLGKLEVLQRQRRKLYEMKTKNEIIRKFIFKKLGRNFENLVEMCDKIVLLNCVLT